jgi:plastocyanin
MMNFRKFSRPWTIVLAGGVVCAVFYGLIKVGVIKFPSKPHDCSKIPKAENAQVIKIENNAFDPRDLTVKICDTLVFLNLDSTPHEIVVGTEAITSMSKKFDYAEFRVTKSGSYSFYDKHNQSITGKIIVNEIK